METQDENGNGPAPTGPVDLTNTRSHLMPGYFAGWEGGQKTRNEVERSSPPLQGETYATLNYPIQFEPSPSNLYSCYMSELDEAWALAMAEAERRAREQGRGDIAEYLALRASNDLLRSTGIEWLFSTLTSLSGEANRSGASLRIEKDETHRFSVGSAIMVGPRVTFRSGVRKLTIEAGWPRTPRDGIVRGNGLACARIGHFGKRAANQELLLVRSPSGAPEWLVIEDTGTRVALLEARLRQHLGSLLSE